MVKHADANAAESAISSEDGRRKRSEATRKRLMDAASMIFAEDGFDGASVERICKKAGLTRGAFYSNYRSTYPKAELLADLIERQRAERIRRIEQSVNRQRLKWFSSLEEAVGSAVDAFLDSQGPDVQWLKLELEFELAAIRQRDVTLVGHAFGEYEAAALDGLAEMITRALEQIDLELTVPAIDAARAVSGILDTWLRQSALQGTYPEVDRGLISQVLTGMLRRLTRPRER